MLRRDSPTFPSRMVFKPEAALEESYVQEMSRNMKQSPNSPGVSSTFEQPTINATVKHQAFTLGALW